MEIDLKEISEIINANADWLETRDVSKAKLFATAARRFIMFTPSNSAQPGGFSTSFDMATISRMMDQAVEFITNNDPSFDISSVSIIGVRHGFR